MKRTLIIFLMASLILLSGCTSNEKKEAINKTYNAILAENYAEAETWAEKAVLEGCDDEKFLMLKTNIEIYNDAEEALNSLDYKLADKKMNGEKLFKNNKMNSAMSDMTRKISAIESIVTLYNKNESSSYSVAIDHIDKLFADFTLTEQQKQKLTVYKESAQQKCIKRAIDEGHAVSAISQADEFLTDTTLSEKQISILKNLKFDAQVAEIEEKINDNFLSSSAKEKLQALLESDDITAEQRRRLQNISPSSSVQDAPVTEQLSPKALIDENSALKKAKQAYPEVFKPNSKVTVTYHNGFYIINITSSSSSPDEGVAITVDALTGNVTNIAG